MQWLINFIEHPQSTIAGLAGGGIAVALLGYISTQAHCDWKLVSWQSVLTFAIPLVIGGMSGSIKRF